MRFLIIIWILLSFSELSAQFPITDSLSKNEFSLAIYTDIMPGQSMQNNATGYMDAQILTTAGFHFELSYKRFLTSNLFVGGSFAYGRVWNGYQFTYDFDNFSDVEETLDPFVERKLAFSRERLNLVVDLGIRRALKKDWLWTTSLRVSADHFLQSDPFLTSLFSTYIPRTGAVPLYTKITSDLAGPTNDNGKFYVVPRIGGSLTFSKVLRNWNMKRIHFTGAVSCNCLTEKGDGAIEFLNYNYSQNVNGEATYKSRLLLLSFGVGLSF